MQVLDIIMNGDNCWPDLRDGFIRGNLVAIARLPNGTLGGRPTVTVRIELPDGQTVLAQTTLYLLSNAIKAFEVAP